jgi:hypothetical protein
MMYIQYGQALPLSHDKPPSCAHAARSHHTTISDADILQKAVTGCLVNLQTADTELQAMPGQDKHQGFNRSTGCDQKQVERRPAKDLRRCVLHAKYWSAVHHQFGGAVQQVSRCHAKCRNLNFREDATVPRRHSLLSWHSTFPLRHQASNVADFNRQDPLFAERPSRRLRATTQGCPLPC